MANNWDKIRNIPSGLKGLTIIGTSDIAAGAIGSIFWFYMASLLGTEQYGQVSYFLSIASIASTISLLGANSTISVYVAKSVKLESTIYLICIIAGLVVALILFFVFSNLGISVYVLGAIIIGLAVSEILAKGLYKSYLKYLLMQKILMVGLSIGLYYMIGINGVLLGIGLSYLIYLIRIYRGFKESRIDFSLVRSRFGFMVNSYVWSLSSTFTGSLDKLIIAPLVGFELLGNYQLGIQFLSVLHILPSIVYKYILPQDASGNPNKKIKQITILSSVGIAVLGIVLSPIIIPLAFPKFTEAVAIIQIMSVSVIPTTINLMFTSKLLGNERIRLILTGSGIYLSVLILSIILLGKSFGINGMATALVLSTFSQTIFYYIVNRFKKKD